MWYINTKAEALPELMTGRSGRTYSAFLPPGELADAPAAALVDLSARWLPAPFARLVGLSRVFMQPVGDLAVGHLLAGRWTLIGDAAGTVRPHTASGTSKAFGDAAGLAAALAGYRRGDEFPTTRLQAWEYDRRRILAMIAANGIALANSSGLGVSNAPTYWPG